MNLKINNVDIYGLRESLIRSGYPMQAAVNDRMDLETIPLEALLERGSRLGSTPTGSGHDNFLKGIIVQFDVNFTITMWKQAERYHWFDVISSSSTSHRLHKMDLQQCFSEYTDKRAIKLIQEIQQEYIATPTPEKFLSLLDSCPCGLRLNAGITTNYLQLKTVYSQRKAHKQPDWREFCGWIESLQYAKELGVC